MIETIRRFLANWHRVPRKKVPLWVRGKLYKQKYVKDGKREYKKIVVTQKKTYYVSDGIDHDGTELWLDKNKIFKKTKFYYRKI